MCILTSKKSDRVMFFIDIQNIGIRHRDNSCRFRLDYRAMVEELADGRSVERAYAFDGIGSLENRDATLAFHNCLRYYGFTVEARDSYDDETRSQKEVDVKMACTILEQAYSDTFDVAIVVSGDRDFVPVIESIKSMGKKVEVASFDEAFSSRLRLSADRYHLLNNLPIFEYMGTEQEVPEEYSIIEPEMEVF